MPIKLQKKTQWTYPEELKKKEEPVVPTPATKNPRIVTRLTMIGSRSRTQVVVRHITITKRQTKLLGSNLEVVQSGSRARIQILERRTT